jgi:tRNA A37 threonylcarbamoyladenosine dehydratase
MDDFPIDRPWEVVLPPEISDRLHRHLFPGDEQEHAAGLLAGVHVLGDRVRLLVKDCVLAEDGVDHVIGPRGYLTVRAQFIQSLIRRAREERLVYLSVHNHLSDDSAEFSAPDMAAHERGYPALLDLAKGMPVGALVFGHRAVVGDIWMPGRRRKRLEKGTLLGRRRQIIWASPPPKKHAVDDRFDRQVRLFGDEGQAILSNTKVGIIGLGGAGSQLAELLARLGVGEFFLVDPDRADTTNLPRLIGSKPSDVLLSEEQARKLGFLKPLADRLRRRKVDLAARNIRRANRHAKITRIFSTLERQSVIKPLLGCDYLFLAADQMVARLAFNAMVHQYLVPGIQIGARVVTDKATGDVSDVFVVTRPVLPGQGCLWCNGLIDPTKLQIEATDEAQAKVQAYGAETPAPSVVSLNALAAADAVNQFQFFMTGLARGGDPPEYHRYKPLSGDYLRELPRRDDNCIECSALSFSRLSKGDGLRLPVKPS